MERRTFLIGTGAMLAGTGMSVPAFAKLPFDRQGRFINPFAAGSAVDVVIRLIAQNMSERLNQTFVVENLTGASGNIGTVAAARGTPDGTTLVAGSPGTFGINPFLFKKLPYDAVKDFTAVSVVTTFPQVVCVKGDSPIKTFAELVELSRKQPGKLNYGHSGSGSTSHLAGEMISSAAGIKFTYVPFRGGSNAIQSLMSGVIDVATEGIPSLPSFISSGQIRPLAVTSEKRSFFLKDVPSVSETVPGFDAAAWVIIFAPSATPAATVDALSREIAISMKDPKVKERLNAMGAESVGTTPAEATAFHKKEMAKWKKAVELSGASIDG